MKVGTKIRYLRIENNISLRKLAEITRLSKSTISEIENNNSKNPTMETLEKIANALNITISTLLNDIEKDIPIKTEDSINKEENTSEIFIRSIARTKGKSKETLDKIAQFINLILDQEEEKI